MVINKQKRIETRLPVWTVSVLLLSIVAYAYPRVSALFIYDRSAIMSGEVWRLMTSHAVHFSKTHLLYNMLAFGASGWIIETGGHRHFGLMCIVMALCTGCLLLYLEPLMYYYGGLSGLACGSISYLALCWSGSSKARCFTGQFVAVLIFLKIVYEFYYGSSVLPYGNDVSFITMPVSHLTGSMTALLFYFCKKSGSFDILV